MSLLDFSYLFCIFLMIFNYLINNKDNLKFLIFNIIILIISTNLVFLLGISDEIENENKILLSICKLLFIIEILTKVNLSYLFNYKIINFVILFFCLCVFSDILNYGFHFIFYLNYVIYILIIFCFFIFPKETKQLEFYIGKAFLFLTLFMLVILIIKFFEEPSLLFRTLRLQSIFPTSDEEGGFLIVFFLLSITVIRNKFFLLIYTFSIVFLLIFAIGTKTSLLVIMIIIFIYFIVKFKKTWVLFLTIFLFISADVLLENLFNDIFFTYNEYRFNAIDKVSNENNFIGRINDIWIPAIRYIYDESFLYGFGVKGWDIVSTYSGMAGGIVYNNFYLRSAHNFFIFYFAESGVLGLIALIIIVIYTTKCLLFKLRNNNFYLMVFLAWVSFIITSMTANLNINSGWVIFCSLIGMTFYNNKTKISLR